MSKETVEEVKVISPGAMLKAAREKQGLSREEVADQLHLRFTIIKDLEEDQYATDISATFTKGYLKLYSKLLGIDEEQVLAAYQQLGTQEKEPAKLQSFSQKVARQASDQRLMWVTYFVLILVLAGVIAWWIQQDDTSLSNFIDRNVSAATQNNEAANSAATNNEQQSATVPADTAASQSSAFPPANTTTSDTSSDASLSDTSFDTSAQQAEATNDSSDNAQNSDQVNVPANTQPANTQVNSQPANNSQDPVAEPVSNSSGSSPAEAQVPAQSNTQTSTQSVASPALETEAGVFATLETDSGQADDLSEPSSSQTDRTELAAQNDNVNQIPNDAEPALNLPLGDPVELVFTFSGDCWMKLTDATGEDVAYGIKQAGRIMPVSGVPPFEVVLGAPESVQISYAGEPIDMARFRPGYTARFQLPLSE